MKYGLIDVWFSDGWMALRWMDGWLDEWMYRYLHGSIDGRLAR